MDNSFPIWAEKINWIFKIKILIIIEKNTNKRKKYEIGNITSELSVNPRYWKIGYRNELLNTVSGDSSADKNGIRALKLKTSRKILNNVKDIKNIILNLIGLERWFQSNLKRRLNGLVIFIWLVYSMFQKLGYCLNHSTKFLTPSWILNLGLKLKVLNRSSTSA